jgi:hypothetical protein
VAFHVINLRGFSGGFRCYVPKKIRDTMMFLAFWLFLATWDGFPTDRLGDLVIGEELKKR